VPVGHFHRSTSLVGSATPGAFAGGAAGIDRRISAVGGVEHLDPVADRRVDYRPQGKPALLCGRNPSVAPAESERIKTFGAFGLSGSTPTTDPAR
jgi:hypothetical protein